MAKSMRKTPAILRGDNGLILLAFVFVVGLFVGMYHAFAGAAEILTPAKNITGTGRTFSELFKPR